MDRSEDMTYTTRDRPRDPMDSLKIVIISLEEFWVKESSGRKVGRYDKDEGSGVPKTV